MLDLERHDGGAGIGETFSAPDDGEGFPSRARIDRAASLGDRLAQLSRQAGGPTPLGETARAGHEPLPAEAARQMGNAAQSVRPAGLGSPSVIAWIARRRRRRLSWAFRQIAAWVVTLAVPVAIVTLATLALASLGGAP